MNDSSYIVGVLSVLIVGAAATMGLMYAHSVRETDYFRGLDVTSRRRLLRQRRQDAADTAREHRLAELTFWEFEQRQRKLERQQMRARSARRSRSH